MAETEGLVVRVEATQARFERDMRRAEQSLARAAARMEGRTKQLNSRLDGIGANFARGFISRVVPALAGPAVIRGFDRMISKLDNIGKTADKLGLTTAELQELRSAAEQSGVSVGTLDMAMQRFGRRVAEARQGTGEAKAALAEMGIELRNADGSARPLVDVLNDVANKMQVSTSQTDRNRIAMRLFDTEGVALVNMLRDGAAGLDQMRQRAQEMGAVVGDDAVRAAEALRTEIDLLASAIGGRLLQAAGSAAMALNQLFNIGTKNQLASNIETLRDVQDELARIASEGSTPGLIDRLGAPLANLPEFMRRALDPVGALSTERPFANASKAELERLEAELVERNRVLADRLAIENPPPLPEVADPLAGGSGGAGGKSARQASDQAAVQLMEQMRQRIQLLTEEISLVGRSEAEQARLSAGFDRQRMVRELLDAAAREGATITTEEIVLAQNYAAEVENLTIALFDQRAAIEAKAEAEKAAAERAEEHAKAIAAVSDRLSAAIIQADNFKDALKNIGIELLNLSVQGLAGEGPLKSILGGVLPAVVGAVGSAFGGPNVGTTDAFGIGAPFAKGGVFKAGKVTAFASGGVVTRPTVFPMADGAGLMGEAGPEAIMPLAKGPGGKLGVRAVGGGGGSFTFVSNIDARGSTLSEGQFRSIAQQEAQRAVAGLVSARRDDPTLLR